LARPHGGEATEQVHRFLIEAAFDVPCVPTDEAPVPNREANIAAGLVEPLRDSTVGLSTIIHFIVRIEGE
jgi:hypothetical protein